MPDPSYPLNPDLKTSSIVIFYSICLSARYTRQMGIVTLCSQQPANAFSSIPVTGIPRIVSGMTLEISAGALLVSIVDTVHLGFVAAAGFAPAVCIWRHGYIRPYTSRAGNNGCLDGRSKDSIPVQSVVYP
jgi:hypothetical protein